MLLLVVTPQIAQIAETVATDGALMLTLCRVTERVFVELLQLCETLRTQLAHVQLLQVDPLVLGDSRCSIAGEWAVVAPVKHRRLLGVPALPVGIQ